jgi:hypothetical protein
MVQIDISVVLIVDLITYNKSILVRKEMKYFGMMINLFLKAKKRKKYMFDVFLSIFVVKGGELSVHIELQFKIMSTIPNVSRKGKRHVVVVRTFLWMDYCD